MRGAERAVALATCKALPVLAEDDRALIPALKAEGLAGTPAVWDDAAVDWTAVAGVLIRCCWDYHLKLPAFLSWLTRLETLRVPVWNAPALLRWNATKRYLEGCPSAVPTEWLSPGRRHDAAALLAARGWTEAVVKPVVGASAHKTVRVRAGDAAAQAAVDEAVEPHGAMLQPFLPEVLAEGEWSFIFIDGAFSHAVLKKPGAGDFRVQEEHGGSVRPAEPSAGMIDAAAAALGAAPAPWLYARVDAIRSGRALLVSELELVEPSLYFAQGPGAAARLAAALRRRL